MPKFNNTRYLQLQLFWVMILTKKDMFVIFLSNVILFLKACLLKVKKCSFCIELRNLNPILSQI